MTDTTDTDTTTEEQRIRTLLTDRLDWATRPILHDIITKELGDDEAEAAVDAWRDNEWDVEKTAEEWGEHPEIYQTLRNFALQNAEEDLQVASEQGGFSSYLSALDHQVSNSPEWFGAALLQSARDDAERRMFTTPRDWRRLIAVLQIEARTECATRDLTNNHDERREAWDELLKFTLYRVKVTYTIGDGTTSITAEDWEQKSSQLHNRTVERIPPEGTFERADMAPVRRAQPGKMQDPLLDLEPFVYYVHDDDDQ